MFNDILGNKETKKETPSQDSLIKSLRYSNEKKEEFIQQLLKKITDLERQLENTGIAT